MYSKFVKNKKCLKIGPIALIAAVAIELLKPLKKLLKPLKKKVVPISSSRGPGDLVRILPEKCRDCTIATQPESAI
jgi:hypothetical protein